MVKAQLKFVGLRRKQDESLAEYNAAKDTQTASMVSKLGKKADGDTKSSEKSDKEYTKSVEALLAVQEKTYKNDMPTVLQDLQQIEMQRISGVQNFLRSFAVAQQNLPAQLARNSDAMMKGVDSINAGNDIIKFVQNNKTDKAGPDYAKYVSFEALNDGTVPMPTPPKSTFRSVASRNTIAIPNTSPSSTMKDSKSSNSNKKIMTALYDYNGSDDNELTFKANDEVEVMQTDDSGWWSGKLVKTGKVGVFPSNFVKDPKAQTPQLSGEQLANKKCKAIYDYPKSEEGELAMKVNQIFTIDYEEGGWLNVYDEQGQYGRIPSNYVQVM